jgi:hypothetical protein
MEEMIKNAEDFTQSVGRDDDMRRKKRNKKKRAGLKKW